MSGTPLGIDPVGPRPVPVPGGNYKSRVDSYHQRANSGSKSGYQSQLYTCAFRLTVAIFPRGPPPSANTPSHTGQAISVLSRATVKWTLNRSHQLRSIPHWRFRCFGRFLRSNWRFRCSGRFLRSDWRFRYWHFGRFLRSNSGFRQFEG